MARKKKKQNGIGAVCQALMKFMHPRPIICAKYPNATATDRLEGLLVIRKELKKVNRVDRMCIIFRHGDFENKELHCVERYCNVTTEGAAADYFDEVTEVTVVNEEEKNNANEAQELPPLSKSDLAENIAKLRMEGYDVDDDNDPAPENIPDATAAAESSNLLSKQSAHSSIYGEWDSCTICHRTTQGLRYEKAKFTNEVDNAPGSSYIDYFLYLLPCDYINEILLVETNKKEEEDITFGELMVYIGLWLLMSTTSNGCDRRAFWENSPISPWKGAPFRFNEYMPLSRFDYITKSLTFTNLSPPTYVDKFHEVRQLIKGWNQHMKKCFIPSWISCLDESMSIWTSRWTCPGWMYVPRKPHPQGNEYHSIACGESGIMYAIELVEGKDKPKEKEKEKYSEHGKTASLLLRLCESIFQTGKIVVLDSGFCVLNSIISLKKFGVFASALVKKRRYWPTNVNGDLIKQQLHDV